jgi:hypothetical protein
VRLGRELRVRVRVVRALWGPVRLGRAREWKRGALQVGVHVIRGLQGQVRLGRALLAYWNLEYIVKPDEFCLARSCYLSKAKRERDSLAEVFMDVVKGKLRLSLRH